MLSAPSRYGGSATRAGTRRAPGQRLLAERLLLAAIAVIVLVAGLSSMDGTYAMWRDQTDADAGTLTSGTASLAAAWSPDHDESRWQNLLPGESVQRELALTNTGDVPMEVSATVPEVTEGLEIRALAGTAVEPLSSPALGATELPLAVAEAPGASALLEAEESVHVTVEITATETLTPGDQVHFNLQFEGRQTR